MADRLRYNIKKNKLVKRQSMESLNKYRKSKDDDDVPGNKNNDNEQDNLINDKDDIIPVNKNKRGRPR